MQSLKSAKLPHQRRHQPLPFFGQHLRCRCRRRQLYSSWCCKEIVCCVFLSRSYLRISYILMSAGWTMRIQVYRAWVFSHVGHQRFEFKLLFILFSPTSNFELTMMKATTLAILAGSAAAFAPATPAARSSVALNAEKSQALPFLNRPALVSQLICKKIL